MSETPITHRCPSCAWVGAPDDPDDCPACGAMQLLEYEVTIAD